MIIKRTSRMKPWRTVITTLKLRSRIVSGTRSRITYTKIKKTTATNKH